MINKTKDYSIFKIKECNRKLEEIDLRKLENSIKFKNMLHIRPIIVDANMEIIDGQHRLVVAKKLDLDIYYTIDQDSQDSDIILLNNNQKNWKMKDYYNFYYSKNRPDYIRLFEFMEKSKIDDVNIVLSLLGAAGGASYNNFKLGLFKFPGSEQIFLEKIIYIRHIQSFLLSINPKKFKWCKACRVWRALCSLSNKEFFEFDHLIKRIESRVDALHPCTSEAGYVEMFKNIYNWRSVTPID